jgi:hypothetical protein
MTFGRLVSDTSCGLGTAVSRLFGARGFVPGDRTAVPNSAIGLDSAGSRAGSARPAGAVGTRSFRPLLIAMRRQQLAALLSGRRWCGDRFSRSSIVILLAERGAIRGSSQSRV